MKKSILILSVVLLNTFYCFSQNDGYVAISLGRNIPTGAFGSKDLNNNAAGFATSGGSMDVSVGIKLNKNFGLCGMLRADANPLDAQALADEFHKANPSASFKVEGDGWGYVANMIGVYSSFPIGRSKTSFQSKVMLGYIGANSPNVTITMGQESNTEVLTEESGHANALGFLIGAGIKYDISRKFCLLTNLDYLGAKPEFKDVKTSDSIDGNSTASFSQNMGTLNFTFGVGLRF